jgi:alkylhydroperoxidase family enzyme
LGTAVVFMAIWLGMVFMAGAPLRHLAGVFVSLIVGIPFIMLLALNGYQRERLAIFIDPSRDPFGTGFNIVQSQIGIGSGGLLGKGLTHGTQTQLDYLRTQTTDYVFSVLGEELGFVGAMVLFLLFIILLMRGLRAVNLAPDNFGRLIATGTVIMILFQVFINIGVNLRLFPVTGIPLPFISQGGSSLVTLFAALGILQSILQTSGSWPGTSKSPSRHALGRRVTWRKAMARLVSITSKDQVDAKDAAVVDAIVESRGAIQGPFTMFLHCPELAGRLAHLGAYIRFEGPLDMRIRVLAAMTVARELDAVYIWGAQSGGARRLDVPEETIAAIRAKRSDGMPAEDAQIVDFTRQLLRNHRADGATFEALRRRLGDEQLIQLTGTIGYYSMLAMTVNACELEAGAGAEVLEV